MKRGLRTLLDFRTSVRTDRRRQRDFRANRLQGFALCDWQFPKFVGFGADQQRVYQDIQQQVDRIRTFPLEAEEPVISLDIRRREDSA